MHQLFISIDPSQFFSLCILTLSTNNVWKRSRNTCFCFFCFNLKLLFRQMLPPFATFRFQIIRFFMLTVWATPGSCVMAYVVASELVSYLLLWRGKKLGLLAKNVASKDWSLEEGGGGTHSTMEHILASHPAARGLILGFPKNFSLGCCWDFLTALLRTEAW